MTQTAQVKQYIYDWLVGLKIGMVFQDRKPMDDTTKTRDKRTYIIYYFENGLEDMGGWFEGVCTVILGARDEVRFTSPELQLAAAEKILMAEFDKNDDANGVSCVAIEKIDDGPDGVGNHEYVYQFDVRAEKRPDE